MVDTSRYRNQIPDQTAVRSILSGGLAEQWRFLAVMPDLGPAATAPSNYSFTNGGASYNSSSSRVSKPQIPNAIAESVNIAEIQADMDDRYGQGTSISVPRKWTYPDLTINFYEDQAYNVTKYLWAWKLLIADGNQLYNLPTVYKKDIDVWVFDATNNYAPVMIVNFIECCPTTFIGGLTYGQTNGFLTVSSNFKVDDQEFQFMDPVAAKTRDNQSNITASPPSSFRDGLGLD
jgi:hypothetical protein